jgi:hypothetical protein
VGGGVGEGGDMVGVGGGGGGDILYYTRSYRFSSLCDGGRQMTDYHRIALACLGAVLTIAVICVVGHELFGWLSTH